ncbi:MAG: branched-chain amino acid aminotransferase, partial [Clostridia bacterium]|nr:branched-chain amino acid aminotransferase [Clostridia bacterium]
VLLNNEGYVAEATGDNIFVVRKGVLITPPIYVGLLEGVTRNCVMDLARKRGIEVKETLFTRMDMYTADECFLTGTAAEVIPAVKYDGRVIGTGKPGEITKTLIQDYRDYVKNAGDGAQI